MFERCDGKKDCQDRGDEQVLRDPLSNVLFPSTNFSTLRNVYKKPITSFTKNSLTFIIMTLDQ